MSFQTNASQDDNHPLINFAAGGQGVDLFDQFVTFNSDLISCGGVGNIGVEISPNGESNGNNFNFNNVAGKNCNTAVAQIGSASNNAFNALSNIWYGGDIQNARKYGLAAYAGQWIVHGTTFEDGQIHQTGEDVYCHTAQLPCIIDGVRSESFHLASGNVLSIQDSKTIFQGATWDQSNLARTVAPLNQVITGDQVTGDGAYYYVTVPGTWGGLSSTNATGGSAQPSSARFVLGQPINGQGCGLALRVAKAQVLTLSLSQTQRRLSQWPLGLITFLLPSSIIRFLRQMRHRRL